MPLLASPASGRVRAFKSGSTGVVSLLTRLGICTRSDNPSRHRAQVVTSRRKTGMAQELTLDSFSMTSGDNIDRSAPAKCITTSALDRGFHDTSGQHTAIPVHYSEYGVLANGHLEVPPHCHAASASPATY